MLIFLDLQRCHQLCILSPDRATARLAILKQVLPCVFHIHACVGHGSGLRSTVVSAVVVERHWTHMPPTQMEPQDERATCRVPCVQAPLWGCCRTVCARCGTFCMFLETFAREEASKLLWQVLLEACGWFLLLLGGVVASKWLLLILGDLANPS